VGRFVEAGVDSLDWGDWPPIFVCLLYCLHTPRAKVRRTDQTIVFFSLERTNGEGWEELRVILPPSSNSISPEQCSNKTIPQGFLRAYNVRGYLWAEIKRRLINLFALLLRLVGRTIMRVYPLKRGLPAVIKTCRLKNGVDEGKPKETDDDDETTSSRRRPWPQLPSSLILISPPLMPPCHDRVPERPSRPARRKRTARKLNIRYKISLFNIQFKSLYFSTPNPALSQRSQNHDRQSHPPLKTHRIGAGG